MKHFVKLCSMIMMIITSMTLFASCAKKQNLIIATDIKDVTGMAVKNFITTVYGSDSLDRGTLDTKGYYNADEIHELFPKVSYYVRIGVIENIEDVTSITLGAVEYKKDDEIELSIGNNNYIKDKCFYVKESSLYIAGPMLVFETDNNTKIKVNSREYNIESSHNDEEIKLIDVKLVDESAGSVDKVNDKQYNVVLNNTFTRLELSYKGVKQSDYILSRKIQNNVLRGYELTKVENIADYPITFYPVGYYENITDVDEELQESILELKAYVVDKGMFDVRFDISINIGATDGE